MAGYIGSKTSVVSSGVERKKTYSITGSTTSLTGLNYTVGKVHVYQNGVRLLDGTDYTATNGTSITLTVAAQSGDNVVVVSQASFQLSESYTSTESDARYVQPTHTGNLDITGTVNADGLNVQNGSNAGITFDLSTNYTPVIKGSQTVSDLYLEAVGGGGFKVSTTDKSRLFIQNNGDISFYEDTGTTAKFFWDSSAESLGIGTSNPTNKLFVESSTVNSNTVFVKNTSGTGVNYGLEIAAGTNATDHALHVTSSTGSSLLRVNGVGNVGIGTSSPSSPKFSGNASGVLEVKGTKPSFNIQESDVTNAHFNMSMTGGDAYLGATGTGNLVFATGTTNWSERMRIDSSGRVTMPYQPSFSVSKTGGAVGSGTFVIWNHVEHNVGSHYNSSNGVFTAPVSGVYAISLNVMDESTATHTNTELDIYRNSYIYQRVYGTNGVAGTHGRWTWSGNIYMSANDTLKVLVNNMTIYGNLRDYSNFSGFLVG